MKVENEINNKDNCKTSPDEKKNRNDGDTDREEEDTVKRTVGAVK